MNEGLQPFELQREALAERLHLKDQWESQVKALNETGVLEILPESQDIGVIGIDGKEYPVPKYDEIMARITPEKMELLEKKLEQGFTRFLLVPIAMPLDILIDRHKRELIKHSNEGTLLSTDGTSLELNHEDPVYVWDKLKGADVNGTLVYNPKQFNQDHQGVTKQEIINTFGGWEVHLLEGSIDIPKERTGQTIGGRKRLEANHSSDEYLQLLQTDPQYQGETGLTPEAWFTHAISHLHLTNQQIDDWQGNGKACFLTGSYLPSDSSVPDGYWDRGARRAGLSGDGSNIRNSYYGARSSVKILKLDI